MPQKTGEKKPQRPAQQQDRRPGLESEMTPRPVAEDSRYRPANKLRGKVALITGGDSGIGRAVAILFAREGADVVIGYLNEHKDAEETLRRIEGLGCRGLALAGDVGDEEFCKKLVERTLEAFGRLDILVNNAAEQHPQNNIQDITAEQLERTFRTNIFSYFYMAKAALKHMECGAAIINTTSVTAYRGSAQLLDYAATKGAIVAFTRSLSQSVVDKGIRVNAVAPGPVWTPLIPSTFDAQKTAQFGSDAPMGRAAEPEEIAPGYVFLACDDSSYISGQVLHPNGGEIVNA